LRKATLLNLPKDGGADAAFDKLEGNVPEGDARYRRELVPREALLPDRRLAFGRKGPNAARPFAHPGLVDEDDGLAFSRAVFLCRPTLLLPMQDRGCACLPRPLGRWQEKFNFLMSRHTPDSEYRLELIFAMSLAPRASVHGSVAYPCAKAPASSASTNRFFSASVSRGGR
jgi:hypothetical protein